MQNATSLTETGNQTEITRQTAIMRNTTKLNDERIAASEEILRLFVNCIQTCYLC